MPAPTSIIVPDIQAVANYPFALGSALVEVASTRAFHLKLAIAFGTADAATLYTIPTGLKAEIERAYWEVTTSFTGGSSSAIGVSSSNTSYATKGDILGGASGDVAATLVSTGLTYKGGTIGAKFGSNGMVVLVGGDTIRFDRITSAFTAGAGFVHLTGTLIETP